MAPFHGRRRGNNLPPAAVAAAQQLVHAVGLDTAGMSAKAQIDLIGDVKAAHEGVRGILDKVSRIDPNAIRAKPVDERAAAAEEQRLKAAVKAGLTGDFLKDRIDDQVAIANQRTATYVARVAQTGSPMGLLNQPVGPLNQPMTNRRQAWSEEGDDIL